MVAPSLGRKLASVNLSLLLWDTVFLTRDGNLLQIGLESSLGGDHAAMFLMFEHSWEQLGLSESSYPIMRLELNQSRN